MSRDEILHLLILEADGGLEAEDQVRLRQAGQQDAELVELRRQVAGVWTRLRTHAAAARMPAGFGEDQLDHWTRSSTDGLLVGAAVRMAAAFLLMATLVRGIAGPICVARVVDGVVPERRLETTPAPARLVTAGTVVESLPGEVRHVQLPGVDVELVAGSVAVETPWRMSVLPGPLSVAVATGKTPMEVHCSGAVILGREVRFALQRTEASPGVLLSVREGSLRLSRGGEVVVLDAGSSEVLPPADFFTDGAPARPSPLPQTPAPPEPRRSDGEEPLTAPDGDDDGSVDPLDSELSLDRTSALDGQITRSGGAVGVQGAMVRLTAVPWRADNDLDDQELPLTGAALMDTLAEQSADSVYFTFTRDAHGFFALDAVPAGLYRLDVLVPRDVEVADAPSRWVRLSAQEKHWVAVDLPAGSSAWGMVVDDAGDPVEGARIRSATRSAEADSSGAFQVHGVGAGEELWVDAPGFLPQRVLTGAWAYVMLERGSELRVRLVSSSAAPVAGAAVTVQWRHGREFLSRTLPRRGPDTFVATGIPEHTALRIVASADGYQRAVLPVDEELRPEDWLELELLPQVTQTPDRSDPGVQPISRSLAGTPGAGSETTGIRSVRLAGSLGTAEVWALWVERDVRGDWVQATALEPDDACSFTLPDPEGWTGEGALVIGTLASPDVVLVPHRDLPADGEIVLGDANPGDPSPPRPASHP